MLQGRLGYREIADLLDFVCAKRSSGVLALSHKEDGEAREARFFFDTGKLVMAKSNQVSQRVGNLLCELGVIDDKLLEKALALQDLEKGARRLGIILCADLGVERERIEQALAQHYTNIVANVFTWPDGEFAFETTDRPAPCDMFCISEFDYLLQAGIDAAALDREKFS